MQKSILITGCSSGIGLDAATTLQSEGWHVLATCRQAKDCDKLKEQGIDSFVLDYADSKSVLDRAAQALERLWYSRVRRRHTARRDASFV